MLRNDKAIMKILLILVIFTLQTSVADARDPDFGSNGPGSVDRGERPPEYVRFVLAIDDFIDSVNEIKDENLQGDELTKALNDLQAEHGAMVARAYFHVAGSLEAKNWLPKMDAHLAKALKENAEFENYFIHLGNAFWEQAGRLIEEEMNYKKKLQVRWQLGGAAVGIFIGGAWIYLRASGRAFASWGSLNWKDFLVGAGAIGVGYGGGFAGGKIYIAYLPVDPGVKTAEDFKLKYPDGKNYLDTIRKSIETRDLALQIAAIERLDEEDSEQFAEAEDKVHLFSLTPRTVAYRLKDFEEKTISLK